MRGQVPTQVEQPFPPGTVAISKTDARGVIVYADRVFLRLCGYSEAELIGRPHAIVRHPDMPRCIFWHFWRELEAGNEVFAYLLNLAKSGAHYWLLAYASPDFDPVTGAIIGYHSCRRPASPAAIARVAPIYRQLLAAERGAALHDQCAAGMATLERLLGARGLTYEPWVFAVSADPSANGRAAGAREHS